MLFQSKLFSRLTIVALALPIAGFSDALHTAINASGNGGSASICEYGTCASPGSIGPGPGAISFDTIGFTYTFADGDKFQIGGSYSNTYPPQELNFNPSVTYMGTSPSLGADTLTLDMLQNFFDPSPGSWAGSYCETFPVVVPAGTSATADANFDGKGVGLLTQTGPASTTQHACKSLDFGALDSSATITTDYTLTFSFAKGTAPGVGITSLTPEPVQTIPAALSLVGLLAFVKARKSRS